MTAGNVTFNRQVDTPTDFGVTPIGTLTQRVWSGNDWPQTKHVDRPRLDNPVMDYSRRGRAIMDKHILANNRELIRQYKETIKASQLRKIQQRIVEGNKAHPYSFSLVHTNRGYDYLKFSGNARIYTASPTQPGGNPTARWPKQWDSSTDTLLINRLKGELLGSNFNAGVFFAELGPAITMITNSASRLYRSRKALLRGDLVAAWKALSPMGSTYAPKVRRGQPIASQWLEMSYGWMPLLSDLDDAAKMLAHNDVINPTFFRARSRAKIGGPGNLVWKKASDLPFTCEFLGTQTETGQIVAYLREVNVPQLLGLTDVASVAWEATPFSFLGDYVIPIGNYLAARGVAQALKGEFVTSRKRDVHIVDYAYKTATIVSTPRSTLYWRDVSGSRIVGTTLNVPMPAVKPLNEIPSWKKAANVVALLITTGSLPKGVKG